MSKEKEAKENTNDALDELLAQAMQYLIIDSLQNLKKELGLPEHLKLALVIVDTKKEAQGKALAGFSGLEHHKLATADAFNEAAKILVRRLKDEQAHAKINAPGSEKIN